MIQQWNAAYTAQSYQQFMKRSTAKDAVNKELAHPYSGLTKADHDLAQKLLLDLPGVDWTVELDVLGRHRITIHFKGLGISIDE